MMPPPEMQAETAERIELVEGGAPVEATLDAELVELLVARRIIDAVPLASGRWFVSPRTKVGSVHVGGVTVAVAPKIPIEHIVFLLGYAKDPGWIVTPVEFAPHDEFVQAVADAFARQAGEALRRGAIQGYRETEDELAVLRGRLREQEQLRRRYGVALPLLVRYDEYTTDIAENRILRAATEHLLHLRGLRAGTVAALRSLRMNLAEVSVLAPGAPLPWWQPSRLNERYRPALGLAAIVIAGSSFSHHAPDRPGAAVLADGFMVEMATVFEAFVTTALGRQLEAFGGRFHTQYPDRLDVGGVVRIEADLVWSLRGLPAAVIDAKYKAEKPSGYPNADVYQMLAYCTALGLPVGHLVYAKGNEDRVTHQVRNVDVTIHAHTLDLLLPPSRLIDQVATLAGVVAGARADPTTTG